MSILVPLSRVELITWGGFSSYEYACSVSEGEAQLFGKHGRIRKVILAGATGIAALGVSIGASTPAGAVTYIGTLYEHANYGGAQYWIYMPQDGFSCTSPTGDIDGQVSSLPGFNDITSSFRGYKNCWTKIYEHNDFKGDSLGYRGDTSSVGTLNVYMSDRTSSVRYS